MAELKIYQQDNVIYVTTAEGLQGLEEKRQPGMPDDPNVSPRAVGPGVASPRPIAPGPGM